MTVNVKKMKPVEMVRFLNSTELGTVLSAATVYRHFADAGYRIASTEDSRCLSFYRYSAWLIDRRNTPPQQSEPRLTLCNPIDGSPPGSPVPRILQARTLEWVAISFSNA